MDGRDGANRASKLACLPRRVRKLRNCMSHPNFLYPTTLSQLLVFKTSSQVYGEATWCTPITLVHICTFAHWSVHTSLISFEKLSQVYLSLVGRNTEYNISKPGTLYLHYPVSLMHMVSKLPRAAEKKMYLCTQLKGFHVFVHPTQR